jgi:membrane-bound lytic murein transglycosylase D
MHFKIIYPFYLFLILSFSAPLQAVTNAKGDEIIILKDEVLVTPLPASMEAEKEEADLIAEKAFVPAKSIWNRLISGYKLTTTPSKKGLKRLARHENWYATHPEYFNRMILRSERYLYHVLNEVEKRNMPTEIALLPMIESAYNPLAKSKAKAVGIWQFISSTGRLYGLEQDWWRDDRRSVINATDSALDYLEKLYEEFGTWEHALAAYNCGEGCVGRQIKKNKRYKRGTDFYSLNVPMETRNYVPKLLAISNIIKNPAKYGLTRQEIYDQPYFAEVTVPDQIDVEVATKFADIPLEEFQLLNAEHNRPIIKSNHGGEQVILLPNYSVEKFNTQLYQKIEPLSNWTVYKPSKGERLKLIAKKFKVDARFLARVNQVSINKRFSSKHIMIIPNQDNDATKFPTASGGMIDYKTIETHRIEKGETLSEIAGLYGVTVKDIMEFNELRSTRIRAGDILDIPK